jgi:hypothetical protein
MRGRARCHLHDRIAGCTCTWLSDRIRDTVSSSGKLASCLLLTILHHNCCIQLSRPARLNRPVMKAKFSWFKFQKKLGFSTNVSAVDEQLKFSSRERKIGSAAEEK